ncbi:MAG: hypothetical protein HQ582_32095, partial [Planctomycetes bacterium]|nr:hypothetical protein [Planctomycetota bacterium]
GQRWLTATLDLRRLVRGRNGVTLKLASRSSKSADPRTVTALELDVVFPLAVTDGPRKTE